MKGIYLNKIIIKIYLYIYIYIYISILKCCYYVMIMIMRGVMYDIIVGTQNNT